MQTKSKTMKRVIIGMSGVPDSVHDKLKEIIFEQPYYVTAMSGELNGFKWTITRKEPDGLVWTVS